MSEQLPVMRPKARLLCVDVDGFDSLAELVLDMRSSWDRATDEVLWELDAVLWVLTQGRRGRKNGTPSSDPSLCASYLCDDTLHTQCHLSR